MRHFVLVVLLFMPLSVSAAQQAVVEIPTIVYDDVDNKPFGIDDRLIFTVQSRINAAPGLRVRVFPGTKGELLARRHRMTRDGCAIIDSSVYPLRRVDGRINLGFIITEGWLRRDMFTGELLEAQYTAVVEQGRDRVTLIKIAPADMDAYFKYAFEFRIRPIRQVTRNEPLTVPQQRHAHEQIDIVEDQRDERVATIMALPDDDVEKQCVVFRTVAVSSFRASPWRQLWARLFRPITEESGSQRPVGRFTSVR